MTWGVYRGDGVPREVELPEEPPWRRFDADRQRRRGEVYRTSPEEVQAINAAIVLRRPLLVTGSAGSGKSSLAYAVAHELSLGLVLRWSITSRTTLQDGLYRYDAIARLQDASLRRGPDDPLPEIGKYLRLGPLGTALAVPKEAKPRVLLVDEIDKSDIDLPNDLLHVLEEGEFSIPEIQRLPPDEAARAQVSPDDDGAQIPIPGGRIHCGTFPIVIFTSNGERDFPPAFLRRCLRLDLAPPTSERLEEIVAAHFKLEAISPEARDLIEQFVSERNAGKQLAIDQLLNAVFLVTKVRLSPEELHTVRDDLILRPLSGS